jgi:hypothetical protein
MPRASAARALIEEHRNSLEKTLGLRQTMLLSEISGGPSGPPFFMYFGHIRGIINIEEIRRNHEDFRRIS